MVPAANNNYDFEIIAFIDLVKTIIFHMMIFFFEQQGAGNWFIEKVKFWIQIKA